MNRPFNVLFNVKIAFLREASLRHRFTRYSSIFATLCVILVASKTVSADQKDYYYRCGDAACERQSISVTDNLRHIVYLKTICYNDTGQEYFPYDLTCKSGKVKVVCPTPNTKEGNYLVCQCNNPFQVDDYQINFSVICKGG